MENIYKIKLEIFIKKEKMIIRLTLLVRFFLLNSGINKENLRIKQI